MFARVLTIALALLWLAGCEETNHETIDKWTRTRKGYDKLKTALADESLDPDLSAHAGANLVKTAKEADVRTAMERMSPGRREQVITKLAPRLWEIARVEDEKVLPNPPQVTAKDALIHLRTWANDAQRQQIDTYLMDWYAVISYERRAEFGSTLGAAVVRMIGPPAGKKLMTVANGVIAAPGQDKVKNRIGDELLLGLAASGDPEAVKYVLDIAKMDRGDPSLPKRALSALYKAYLDPGGLFDIQGPEPLRPHLDAIVAIAKDDTQPGQVINDAVGLIGAVGPPHCLAPLVGMIATPHESARFKFVAANNAIKCGGAKALAEVIRALPTAGAYYRDDLKVFLIDQISRLTPRAAVQAALRELLADKSTIARWVAIEALAAIKSTEDLGRIKAMAGSKAQLVGYWGERNPEGKADPTLGRRAKELAEQMGRPAPEASPK